MQVSTFLRYHDELFTGIVFKKGDYGIVVGGLRVDEHGADQHVLVMMCFALGTIKSAQEKTLEYDKRVLQELQIRAKLTCM
jgi:hypothetical protein